MNRANPWLLFVVFGLVILIQIAICTPATKDTVSAAKYDVLQQKVKDTIKYYEAMLKADSAAINSAEQATADQVERVELYQRSLSEAQTTINRLAAKVKRAKAEPQDNTWVEVSPSYVKSCDSLADHIADLGKKVTEYEDQSAELVKLMSYEVSIRDSVLNNEREFNAKFRSQLDNCMMQLKGKSDAKQRVQIYAGMGVLGNQINPLGGAQVNLGLRARNSQMYEVTGAMMGNTWYAGVGTKFLISFKR